LLTVEGKEGAIHTTRTIPNPIPPLFPLFDDNIHVLTSTFYGIMASGHQLLFEFDTFYIRVLLALHCQIVPCTRDIFQKVRSSTYTIGNILVVWQLAIELVEDLPLCFLFTDYNRLISIIVVTKGPRCQKWDPERNCDPMEDWETYERQIRNRRSQYLQKKISIVDTISTDTLFNGFGVNQTTEALFYARIHPMTNASTVFNDKSLFSRLLFGLKTVSQFPPEWKSQISKSPTLAGPFLFDKKGWEYFNSCVNKVYQKGHVGIPIEEYKDYRARKLVMARRILEAIGKTDCIRSSSMWMNMAYKSRKRYSMEK